MTDLRTAAQQALEVMEAAEVDPHSSDAVYKAITALRAALTEDAMQKFTDVNQELQAALGCDHCNSPLYAATRCRVCGRVTEPVQEPVAWRWGYRSVTTGEMDWRGYVEIAAHPNLRSPEIIMEPLYTAPPQRPAEPVQEPQGCAHCNHPLYAAVKCRVCGRETPIIEPKISLGEDVLECPNCASLKAQNTELDRKLAEMEAKLNNQNVDDAFRILAEANRRAIDYINHLEAENAKLRKGPV